MDSPYLSVDETAEYLRYKSRQTVYNKISDKEYIEGIHYIKNGRKPLFLKKALDEMLLGRYENKEPIDENVSALETAVPIAVKQAPFKSAINI